MIINLIVIFSIVLNRAFFPPEMKSNAETFVDEMAVNGFENDTIFWVDITFIKTPSDFYVRPVRFKKLVQHYENLKPTLRVTSALKENQLILYDRFYYLGGEKYARGMIKKNHHDREFDIFAIDYGFTEKRVPLSYLRECPPDLLDVPPLAYHSLLVSCFPVDFNEGWTKRSTLAFKKYALEGRAKMSVLGRTSRQLIISLMNANFDDISKLLSNNGFSDPGPKNSCITWQPIIVRKTFKYSFKKLHVDDSLRVKVVSGTSLKLFYVIEVSDCGKFIDKINEMTISALKQYNLLPRHLREGTVVCAKHKYRNRYDRAFIKRVTVLGSKALLHLVDWGTDEEFTIDKIKYMSQEAISTPVYTIMCSAPENQAWDNGCRKFLEPGFEFYIKIKTLGYEFERENEVDILPINTVETEGATCLGFYNKDFEPKEQNANNFLQPLTITTSEKDEPQYLNAGNILPEIQINESVEELITWIKGMGIKRPNIDAYLTFIILQKFIGNYKEYARVTGYTGSSVPENSDQNDSSSNVATEMPSTSDIQAGSPIEGDQAVSRETLPSVIDKSEKLPKRPKNDDDEFSLSDSVVGVALQQD